MTQFERIKIVKNDNEGKGIAEVILNRPKQYNVMDGVFFDEIGRAFRSLNEDDEVNVIILWSEGKLFTAGLDLKVASTQFMGGEGSQIEQNVRLFKTIKKWQDDLSTLRNCKKPIIAAIHGQCIGGGVDLVCAADIRLCTQDASFSIKETKVGIVADLGTLQRINKLIGSGIVRELAFTSESLTSERALQCNFVNFLYPDKETLLEEARKLASKINSNSPLVVQGTKHIINFSEEHSIDEGLLHVALWNTSFLQSDDLIEAVMSYLQKRPPVFKNRL